MTRAQVTSPGFTIWLTGLSGAGKTTLARAVQAELAGRGHHVEILDGDEIRSTLSRDLGFSKDDRDANVRRIGFIAHLLSRNGIVAIVAAIAPYRATRNEVRRAHEAAFIEIFVDCPLDELIRRDPKGLYKRALRGEISNLSGVSAPYEPPSTPEVHVKTNTLTVEESRAAILRCLESRGLVLASSVRGIAP